MIIDREAMCKQVRDDTQGLYILEHGKSCHTEILEALTYAVHVPDEQLQDSYRMEYNEVIMDNSLQS